MDVEARRCADCGAYTYNGDLHECPRYNGPPCKTCGEPTLFYTVGAPGFGSGRACRNGHDEELSPHGIFTIEQVV